MKQILPLVLCASILLTSCIPTRVAPRFKHRDHRIMVAKKFKRELRRETSFIFKDPKDVDEFYNYINTKYQLDHKDVGYNVPFIINDKTFYLSYYETDIPDKNFNLLGLIVDAKLDEEGYSPIFNEYVSREGHWYLILTVHDENVKNCLLEKHPMRREIIGYLKHLKAEYLGTQNYEETLFAKKS